MRKKIFLLVVLGLVAGHLFPSGIPWLPPEVKRWEPLFEQAGVRHGVSPDLLAIITLVESGGNPAARSAQGARGLMQIWPPTARVIEAERGLSQGYCYRSPAENVDCGAYYLAQQLGRFGRLELAVAAYNGGPGAASSGRWPAETRLYVQRVMGLWRDRNQATSPTLRAWLNK